ncbi:MAG TPA: fucose-binding protein [Actinomycetales bacterium]|nr:fucose-binding protein [Actinomycetales bacterium]
MLKGIDPRLSPDLLFLLAQMGHGDRLALVDRNYPAESAGVPVVRMDAVDLISSLEAVLSVFPVDTFVEHPVAGMNHVDTPDVVPEVQTAAFDLVNRVEGRDVGIERIERFAFYAAARECFVVVITGEDRPYGCVMLTKGVL